MALQTDLALRAQTVGSLYNTPSSCHGVLGTSGSPLDTRLLKAWVMESLGREGV